MTPPMRPILSSIGTYNYILSKKLVKMLTPYLDKTYPLSDTFHFLESLKSNTLIPENIFMVSYDVTSLFTCVPVEKTISYILSKIATNEIGISKQTLEKLLRISCLKMPFMFNGQTYKQIEGMAMGSPLSCLMAGFAMEMVESKMSSYEGEKPLLHKRYVDDCFDVFTTRTAAYDFLDFLNMQLPELKFTIEEEKDQALTFLDVNVSRKGGVFTTSWNVKSTNTGLYVPYFAFCSQSYKNSIPRALFRRAFEICSSYSGVTDAFSKIFDMLRNNGFPQRLLISISTIAMGYGEKLHDQMEDEKVVFWKLPYMGESKDILRKIRSLNRNLDYQIRPIFESFKTANMFNTKDVIPNLLRSSVIYQYSCDKCQNLYIGRTSRHLGKRIREHMSGHLNSEIFLHEHPVKQENFRVVLKHRRCDVGESILIKELKQNGKCLMNKQTRPVDLQLL